MPPSTSESANECMCSAPNRTLEATTATQVGVKRPMSPMRIWRKNILLHNRPHDPEHDDDDDRREHLHGFANAGVVLQGRLGQPGEVEQGRGRQAADELDDQGGETAHDESEDGSALVSHDLPESAGQRVAEGDAADGEDSDVEHAHGRVGDVPWNEVVTEVEGEEEGVDTCEEDQCNGGQPIGPGARAREQSLGGGLRRRSRCSGDSRRFSAYRSRMRA